MENLSIMNVKNILHLEVAINNIFGALLSLMNDESYLITNRNILISRIMEEVNISEFTSFDEFF